jgi:DNA-binding transcriptional LysR family regulator
MEYLSDMALFVEVVRMRSFHRAALHLQMPASTLSRRIGALEKRLGMRLLHRTTRKVEPTHEGQLYYTRCAPLVEEARLAHEDLYRLRDGVQGVLRLSCSPDFACLHLQPVLDSFVREHTLVRLELDLTVRRVDLLTESADAALRLGKLEDSSLVARHLGDFPAGLFASPQFVKTHGQPADPQALARWECLRMGTGDAFSRWTLVSGGSPVQKCKVSVQGRLVANSMQMLEFLCRSGHGIGLIDLKAAESALQQGALIRVLPQWQSLGAPLHLVTASRLVPQRVRALGDALVRHFQRDPSALQARD